MRLVLTLLRHHQAQGDRRLPTTRPLANFRLGGLYDATHVLKARALGAMVLAWARIYARRWLPVP